MKMSSILVTSAMLGLAGPALAATPFDGTWKADVSSAQFPKEPGMLQVDKGVYTCTGFCTPKLAVPADGKFHAVTGRSYSDEISVSVVDAKSVKTTARMKGKLMGTNTYMVSDDGKSLTEAYVDNSAANGKPLTGMATFTRVDKGPAGSHAMSGQWRQTAYKSDQDANLTFTYKTTGDMLTMTDPTGNSFTAKFGGPAVLIKGDPGKTMAAVAKTGPNTMVETDSRVGKVVNVTTMTVNGGKAEFVSVDKRNGKTFKYSAIRQ